MLYILLPYNNLSLIVIGELEENHKLCMTIPLYKDLLSGKNYLFVLEEIIVVSAS